MGDMALGLHRPNKVSESYYEDATRQNKHHPYSSKNNGGDHSNMSIKDFLNL
jgi:hypothetical protein